MATFVLILWGVPALLALTLAFLDWLGRRQERQHRERHP